mmetsp:Transcript_22956/g.65042  ORF Transcript_22956/g.65042 Transcript_22956/m.65042 type:complete len:300 (+) Transcript_22956:156-1055(+)
MTMEARPVLISKGSININPGYFTEFTFQKALFYALVCIYVAVVSLLAMLEPFMDLECNLPDIEYSFSNPAYDANPCRQVRYALLLGFTPEECSFSRRLIFSIILGGIIGWERRQADRPAGIRTMALVSLGSCLFTINSAMAFLNGPMSWDASRVSAAIPSGVGFLGAGLIFKKEEKSADGESSHIVHGLTTAASLWLSAAVGIASGGELYVPATFGTGLMLILLRFGPRQRDDSDDDDTNAESMVNNDSTNDLEGGSYHPQPKNYEAISREVRDNERAPLTRSKRSDKLKKRASLATLN